MLEPITGGCLCGALRYTANGEPFGAGFCYCGDCRKASGSGFIPFMNFKAEQLSVTGEARQARSPALSGRDAVRNTCAVCGGLVFGGVLGQHKVHTIYAGSLDDPSRFIPRMGIFLRDKPAWVAVPEGITLYDALPG